MVRTSRRAKPPCGTCVPTFLALVVSCSPVSGSDGHAREDLVALERLAFVPAGECTFQPGAGARLSCSNPRPLLVDRYEVTRADWKEQGSAGGAPDAILAAYVASWPATTADWPASYVTLAEARAFAAARGMRLPTAREWLRIACGTSERPYVYPWGGGLARSVANTLELGLGNPAPVGTFEQGRTPLSIYDMAGNVWEWVVDPIPIPGEAYDRGASLDPDVAWAMGGSHLAYLRRLYDDAKSSNYFFEQDLDPRTRSRDVGFRCCADAEEYLESKSKLWSADRDQSRVRAVGATWGRGAVPLLEELARKPGASLGIRTLLDGARS
jgi:formylglycine-generating enzyme required for sulfatase activity